jgi:hypothetical protein
MASPLIGDLFAAIVTFLDCRNRIGRCNVINSFRGELAYRLGIHGLADYCPSFPKQLQLL